MRASLCKHFVVSLWFIFLKELSALAEVFRAMAKVVKLSIRKES
jgi:hypothetical protein